MEQPSTRSISMRRAVWKRRLRGSGGRILTGFSSLLCPRCSPIAARLSTFWQQTAFRRCSNPGLLPCPADADAVKHGATPRWYGRGAISGLCPWRPCRGNSRPAYSGNVSGPWLRQWRAPLRPDTGSWCRTPRPRGISRHRGRLADNRRHRRCQTRSDAGRADIPSASVRTALAHLERSPLPSPVPAVSAPPALDVSELASPLLRYIPWLRLLYPVQDKYLLGNCYSGVGFPAPWGQNSQSLTAAR